MRIKLGLALTLNLDRDEPEEPEKREVDLGGADNERSGEPSRIGFDLPRPPQQDDPLGEEERKRKR